MNILAFDLSTTQTGVAVARIDDNVLTSLKTTVIIPKNPSPSDFGFLKTKQKTKTKSGAPILSYVKHKGEVLTKAEKDRRNYLVRKSSEESRLATTATEIHTLVETYNPFLILMEANMAFRNMDTTRQLAEVAGALQAIATTKTIPLEKINVATARSHWNLSKECINFSKTLSIEESKKVKDLTKETLKHLMLEAFNGYMLDRTMSTDESDALVLLYYWLMQESVNIRK
jgi:hypothetical protein